MWIWLNLAPEKLPLPLARALETSDSPFGISSVSVWETMLTMQKGRIAVTVSPESTLRSWIQSNLLDVIPLDEEIVFLSRTLPFNHDDPADRFIAATAYRLNARLATDDGYLRQLDWLKLFP